MSKNTFNCQPKLLSLKYETQHLFLFVFALNPLLDGNVFTGPIPSEIGLLKDLNHLYFSKLMD